MQMKQSNFGVKYGNRKNILTLELGKGGNQLKVYKIKEKE